MSKKHINSRQKGAAGERELANYLKSRGFDARRGQQFKGGGDSPDVVGLPGFHIECKRTERGNPYEWLSQAQRDAGFDAFPLVVHRRNGKDWIAIMDFADFITALKKVFDHD